METQVSTMRRPCFREEDDDLASIAGFSCVNNYHGYPNQHFICYNNNNNNYNNITSNGSGSIMMRRRNSLRNITSLSSSSSSSNVFSPRSARIFDDSPHFLEACALCNKPLGGNRDIFMYRGDTPFCSEECRQEQIDIDEAKEKNRNYKALRSKKEAKKSTTTSTTSSASSTSSSSPRKTQNYPFRTGTVAAA